MNRKAVVLFSICIFILLIDVKSFMASKLNTTKHISEPTNFVRR